MRTRPTTAVSSMRRSQTGRRGASWLVAAGAFATVAITEPVPTAVLAAASPGCVIDVDGLIGWWRGQESVVAEVGPDLVGSAGYGDGVVRRGFELDGSSELSGVGLAAVSSAVTVAAWVRPSLDAANAGAVQTLMSRWAEPSTDDSARSWSLRIDPVGTLVWSTDELTSRRPFDVTIAAPALLDGGAHHVAATWTPSVATVFVDGAVVASVPSQGGQLNAATSVPVRIGSKSGLGPRFGYVGTIDEPMVFDRSLTAAEVAAVAAAGPAGLCTPTPRRVRLPNPTPVADDAFGYQVAIDGGTVLAGRSAGPAGAGSGSVVVSTGAGSTWTTEAVLSAADGAPGDAFGSAVAIDGDTAVIGAPFDGDRGANAGSAYVFVRTGGSWTQQGKLVGLDTTADDGFGTSVDISGDTIVIGASGADTATGSAYVFVRSGTTWTQQGELRGVDTVAIDLFGASVSIDGDRVVVGAPNDTTTAPFTGSAYVFTRAGTAWTQEAKLVASGGATGDLFGWSVALSGSWVAVGAYGRDDIAGSVDVYQRTGGTTWVPSAELQATDREAGDLFGISVALSGDTMIVGAPWDDDGGAFAGTAWAFRRSGTTWSAWSRPVADAAPDDRAGAGVAIDGDVAVIGSPGAPVAGAAGAGTADVITAP